MFGLDIWILVIPAVLAFNLIAIVLLGQEAWERIALRLSERRLRRTLWQLQGKLWAMDMKNIERAIEQYEMDAMNRRD